MEAKTVHMTTEPTIHQLMAELKEHLSKEVKQIGVVEKMLTPEEAAAYLRIGKTTLYDWIKKEKLPVSLIHRVGGMVYFIPSELYQYVKAS
jgi:excisionase family DNA binding protein